MTTQTADQSAAALIQRVTAVTEEMDLAMRTAIASGKAVPSQKVAGWLSSLRIGLRDTKTS